MKILLIMCGFPWPLDEGGGAQRNTLLCEALRRLGEVRVVVANPRSRTSAGPQVQPQGEDALRWNDLRELRYECGREGGVFATLQAGLPGGLRRIAKNLAICNGDFCLADEECRSQLRIIMGDFQPDLLVCRYLRCAVGTGAAFVSDIPVFLDYDDVDWRIQISRREQAPPRGIAESLHHRFYDWYLERHARKRLRDFAHVWVASDEDKDDMGDSRCSVLPNIPVLPSREADPSQKTDTGDPTILFVGGLTHGPNKEGLDHFLDSIWPGIHRAEPKVKLRVAGLLPDDGGASAAKWRQSPNVEVLGRVDDLGPEYERALFTIAPVYWGSGTKVKLLESLGQGRTCVVTPHALYGVGAHIRHDDSVWCSSNDAEFVDGCLRLLRSEDLCRKLATRGVHVIQDYFSVTRFNAAVAEAVARFA